MSFFSMRGRNGASRGCSPTTSLEASRKDILHRSASPIVTAACLLILAASAGCKKDQPVVENEQNTQSPKPAAVAAKTPPVFDANRAMKDIETQVAFGPRVPNSPAHDKEVQFIKSQLGQCTRDVNLQTFTAEGYRPGETLNLTNVIASFNPTATQRILILTHFDSRPWADEDPVAANKTKPVPAANDGGSGTAVMLELARQFKDNPPPIGVDLLFDDGEDYGKYTVDSLNRYFLGVKYFVKTKPPGFAPMFAILLDMVGDKNAEFKPEGFSLQAAQEFTSEVWRTANSMGLSHFKMATGPTISDDHLPLLQASIPTVDIIDGDLVGHESSDPNRKYWHTTDDLPKHLSTETLDQIGRLLLTLIYDRIPHDIPNL